MEERWIGQHVRPCVETHLKRQTVELIIMPKVNQLLNNEGCTEQAFVRELSLEFDGKKSLTDVKKTLSCIETKVGYEIESRNLVIVEVFVAHMCSSLLGKFFYLSCKEVGYIR